LTSVTLAMYTYIVERTQIYLSKAQASALDKAAKEQGTTRSHLIREAIDEKYKTNQGDDLEDVLLRTAGLWADRTESGEEYVERIRGGDRLDRIYREADQRANDSRR
jgi:predicted DNA-binding protein